MPGSSLSHDGQLSWFTVVEFSVLNEAKIASFQILYRSSIALQFETVFLETNTTLNSIKNNIRY
jgi:hypothetical protein